MGDGMIRVTVYRNDEGRPFGLCVSGHARYAVNGNDIVCAAVSILVINTVNAIRKFTSEELYQRAEEETGTIEFKVPSKVGHDADLLLRSLILGLEGIRNEYGKQYISIHDG